MDQLVILIPIAIGLGLVGLAAFLWSLRSGQFDDLEGAAHRILFDDDEEEPGVGESRGQSSGPEAPEDPAKTPNDAERTPTPR